MNARDFGRRFVSAVQMFGAAGRAANAVAIHRRPDDGTLRDLGIEPKAFSKVSI